MKNSSLLLLLLLTVGLLGAGGPAARAQAPRAVAPQPMPSDEQSYRREVVFGLNFNTQGGLIGGANLRVARVLDDRWLRFWSLEGVSFKNPREQSQPSADGGSFKLYKTNYAFSLRPSIGVQRVLFRKAAEAGVQVNGLLSVGPSLGLLMPYYIIYDRTYVPGQPFGQAGELVNAQYTPAITLGAIYGRAPLFTGASQLQLVPGAHLRAGLSFEYGRYRDAVAGVEAGLILEAFTRRLTILSPPGVDASTLNRQFMPAVYLSLYLGHRN